MQKLNSRFSAVVAVFCILLMQCCLGAEEKCGEKNENRGSRLIDQDFGMALTPDDLLTSVFSPFSSFSPWMFRDYIRPWRQLSDVAKDWGSSIKADKDKFQINLDVQHFSPDEITVKTADGYVVVEGKHEEKKDEHGFVSRQFVRRYALPEGSSPESVVSTLSADGVLTVTAPLKEVKKENERIVPITQTGPIKRESKDADDTSSCQGKDNEGYCQREGN